VRAETETEIEDGRPLATIFERLGLNPIFVYEKLRTEWADNEGHVVVDVTPIGDFAELEGSSDWIDSMAAKLGVSPSNYMKASYSQLFQEWKLVTGHAAANMTFAEIGHPETHSATR
jgi:adenylate cyclase class 2